MSGICSKQKGSVKVKIDRILLYLGIIDQKTNGLLLKQVFEHTGSIFKFLSFLCSHFSQSCLSFINDIILFF